MAKQQQGGTSASSGQVPVLFSITTTLGFSFSSSFFQDGFRYSRQANFNESGIIGRSSPLITYSNTGARDLDVTLEIYADALGDDNKPGEIELDNVVAAFEALVMPVKPGEQPPTLCTVTIGTHPNFQDWKCVCVGFDCHYGSVPVWGDNGTARFATVNLKLKGVEIDNVPASDYVSSGDFKLKVESMTGSASS